MITTQPQQVLAASDALAAGLRRVRVVNAVPGNFSGQVTAAAAAASAPVDGRVDATDIPFVTIDPPGSLDLDQALHLEARGNGFRFRYAIADVMAFVQPGTPVDVESRLRGETIYLLGGNVPLHPVELSEGSASLLPDVTRPAVLWTIDLDAAGEPTAIDVRRALVRSAARLDYVNVQRDIDAGAATGPVALLATVGELLLRRQEKRGAVDLQVPEQEVSADETGVHLTLRTSVRADGWNAQLSLLTGECAARLMTEAGVGFLRVLPPPDPAAIARLAKIASSLGVPWSTDVHWADALRGLDPNDPHAAAVLRAATRVTGSASYVAFDGALPELHEHAGVGSAYAHVTAPLRRLADRYATEVCLSHVSGEPLPADVRVALPELVPAMAASSKRAHAAERGEVDVVEAYLLSSKIGETLDAVVVSAEHSGDGGVVMLTDPPALARAHGSLPLGERVRVRVVSTEVTAGEVRLERA